MQPPTLVVLGWLLSRQINLRIQAFLDPVLASLLQNTNDRVVPYVDRFHLEFVPA